MPNSTAPTIDTKRGLSTSAVTERQRLEGPNELPGGGRRSWFGIAIEVLREPMFLLLMACGGIYLLLGDQQEALMLLGFVVLVGAITFYQQAKTERALAALRQLSSPRALVRRDGVPQRIAGREVVRGDLVLLGEGDRIPADGRLLECLHLAVDESLLSGESVPVSKIAWDGQMPWQRPGGDALPFVFAGTLVTRGTGLVEVSAIGAGTAMGHVGQTLQGLDHQPSGLRRETNILVRRLAIFAVALCVLVGVGYGLTRADWLGGFLAGLTLAMAIMPNELPAVLSIFLALGAWRMSQHRALTRRVQALESLGSISVLCVDKTGTLTTNRMAVRRLYADGTSWEVDDNSTTALPVTASALNDYAILASAADPADPMERAFVELGKRSLAAGRESRADWRMVHQYPLSSRLLAMAQVWSTGERAPRLVAAKGAYEAIVDLCHLPAAEAKALSLQADAMASNGLRVLAIAKATIEAESPPANLHDLHFQLVGLAGLADPVRSTVPAAIAECQTAGIRVVMITGDHPTTARSIATQVGLPAATVLTGPELEQLSDDDLRRRVGQLDIVARVAPEQKLRIVQALQRAGEVVAMTGDGVNDAPALRAANVGIAMGERGTDVAREAADLVLLDDNFSTIVEAIRLGRRVFDNLQSAMAYILAVHLPVLGMSLLPALGPWPLLLLPAHIALLHLVIEPACSVVFEAEPEATDIMRRPPRSPLARLYDRRLVGLSLAQGTGLLLTALTVCFVALRQGATESLARTLTFSALIVANIALIIVHRSPSRSLIDAMKRRNLAFWGVAIGSLALLAAVLYLPPLAAMFHMQRLAATQVLLCLGIGIGSLGGLELMNVGVAWRRRRRALRRPRSP